MSRSPSSLCWFLRIRYTGRALSVVTGLQAIRRPDSGAQGGPCAWPPPSPPLRCVVPRLRTIGAGAGAEAGELSRWTSGGGQDAWPSVVRPVPVDVDFCFWGIVALETLGRLLSLHSDGKRCLGGGLRVGVCLELFGPREIILLREHKHKCQSTSLASIKSE